MSVYKKKNVVYSTTYIVPELSQGTAYAVLNIT